MNINRYAYWLVVHSNNINLEYGVNDKIIFGENSSKNHHHEIPITSALQEGTNTVYFRTSNDEGVQQGTLTLALHILELGTQNKDTVELLSIDSNDIQDENIQASMGNDNKVITLDKNIKKIEAISSQGKGEGYQLAFIIKDSFYPLPYLRGNFFSEVSDLEEKVKKAQQDLLSLYQKKDYYSILARYEKSWAHIAKSYDYGEGAISYADDVDFKSDLDYQFLLDFSRSKLRIEGEGKLVGYHPPSLIGLRQIKGEKSLEVIYCPVFYMLNDDGELQIAG